MPEETPVIPATHRVLAIRMNQNDLPTLDSLQLAIDTAASKRYSLRATARLYNVPYSRLQRCHSNPRCSKKPHGRPLTAQARALRPILARKQLGIDGRQQWRLQLNYY